MGKASDKFTQTFFGIPDGLKSVYNMYYKQLSALHRTSFNWKGLSDLHLSNRIIEKLLMEHGQIAFYNDSTLGLLCLPCVGYGINPVGEPTKYILTAENGTYTKTVNAEDCYVIRANMYGYATQSDIAVYAHKMATIEKTMDSNLYQLRKPFLVKVPEGQKKTADRILKGFDTFEPYVMAFDDLRESEMFDAIPLNIQYYVDKLISAKHETWNDALTMLGINNVNVYKKERLVANETTANDEQIYLNSLVYLNPRQENLERMNKELGTEISVDFATRSIPLHDFDKDETKKDETKKEGADNE